MEYRLSNIKLEDFTFSDYRRRRYIDCWHWSYCLVVGNIYENPELLKKGGEE